MLKGTVVAKGRSTLSAIERSEKALRRRNAAEAQLEEEKQTTIKRLLQRSTPKTSKSELASKEQPEGFQGEDPDAGEKVPFVRYVQRIDESLLCFPVHVDP
jgi:hypothetical protein